ncbi:UDP-N-acetylmuramate dehydrogenase [Silvibacterium sp.]|uniref:UDP-N-acetylmuramate dehydrogenase n=1 Tax=Silvibacterium sp. TaxID=1964179 RepID=UPI0039E3F4C4
MKFLEHVPLAPYTTFGIGGPARWFAEASSEDEALEAVVFARERGLPLFILGGGSNLLVSDDGFPGLVLHIASKGIEQDGDLFRVAAGENWDAFVTHAVELGYAGIECLAGIPGTVGGTPVQNVGAYGQEVAETIVRVRALDLESLGFVEFEAADCAFAYRRSLFNSTARGRYLVTRVAYRLTHQGQPRLEYADLKKYFANPPHPSLAEVAAGVRAIRREKGMLLVDGDADCRSAGSFFKNPIISAEHYARLVAAHGSAIPSYPASDEQVKLPAAWLLDQAGFKKSYKLGRAGISSRHTLALINLGNATASDVLALRDAIITEVEAKFAIHLEPEPVWLGPSV